MTPPPIHGSRPPFSASVVLHNIGEALSAIRSQDRLTWVDVGAILGRSDDQAAKYADGTAEMGIVAYCRGKREWGSRFTGSLHRLCSGTAAPEDDREASAKVARASMLLVEGLTTSPALHRSYLAANRKALEDARDALDEMLRKLVVSA